MKKQPKPTVKKTKQTYYVYENAEGKEFIAVNRVIHTRKIEATSLTAAKKQINK